MKKSLTRRDFLKASGGALASAYVLGLAGCSGEQDGGELQGAAEIQGVAEIQASEGTTLRVMAWNIAKGKVLDRDTSLPVDQSVPRIADCIRAQNPDIVLLNEAIDYYWPGGSDVEDLGMMTGLQYSKVGAITDLGFTARFVAVGILSRYPLVDEQLYRFQNTINAAYAMLGATALVNGVSHRIFSTRFTAHSYDDNMASHQLATNVIRGLDPVIPVIIGGDFNVHRTSPQYDYFAKNSTLTDAAVERPDPNMCQEGYYVDGPPENGPIDHIFYRGPYRVAQTKIRCEEPNFPSDHPWVLVDLSETEPSKPLQVNRTISVPESAGEVDTGIDVGPGDNYAFEAWGTIYAGVFGTRRNNPRGWENIDHDPKFPLHEGDDAHPFSLLGKFEGLSYFYIGTGRAWQSYTDTQVRRLYLRINDDQPGNGNGEFSCNVKVWSDRPLGYQSLQSLNYPTRFVRHAWSLGELTEIHSDLDRRDATFKIVPGLAGSQGISLEASNYPGHFLRHQNYRVKLHRRSEDQLFKEDATFFVVPGLADASWSSLQSFNFPDRYLRHRDSHLWVEAGTGDLFRKDATFKIVDPLWQP